MSYFKEFPIGAAEWIILSADESEYIVDGGIYPGSHDQLNAYRTNELWGLLGISIALWSLEKTIGPLQTDIVIRCNGMDALNKSLVCNPESLTAKGKHFNLIAAIMGYWKQLKTTARPTWVEGHIEQCLSWEHWPSLNHINHDRDFDAKRIA